MKIIPNIPKTDKKVENDFDDCWKRKRFIEVEKTTYKDYLERSQEDLISAKRDIDSEDYYWALIKLYQCVFFACNSLLVKEFGFFSKDHKCLLTALLTKRLISPELSMKIEKVLDIKDEIEKIDNIRMERNIALYHPKAKLLIQKERAEKIMKFIQDFMKSIAEVIE